MSKWSMLSGKAVVSIEQDGDRPYVSVSILTGPKTDGEWCWASESLQNMADYDWLPNEAQNLKPGDSITFRCTWHLSYYRGDWGYEDDDEELEFSSLRVLRRTYGANESRRKKKSFYRSKS